MKLKPSIRVGQFLAIRDIKRSNPWTTLLIVFVMTLTFFNMLFLRGILKGIAQGVIDSYRKYYSGDLLIFPSIEKNTVYRTDTVISVISSLPTKQAVTIRYTGQALLEYNYQNRIRVSDLAENASGLLVGINPDSENSVTHLSEAIVAGSYLNVSDADEVLLGSNIIQKYSTVRGAANSVGTRILKTADVGDRIRIMVNGIHKEVTIKGVITTNNTTMDSRIYMVDTAANALFGNTSHNASEIALKISPGASATVAKAYILKNLGHPNDIVVQTFEEALPSGITSVFDTFGILSDLIGGIALIVGAITIFIVVFVNAVTRRKYIGILKGIGISAQAIELSYVLQAFFYAISGIISATILLIFLLIPFTAIHPFEFPIAKASLTIMSSEIVTRAFVLIITALFSGFVPAWLVTKQNTLDSILGR